MASFAEGFDPDDVDFVMGCEFAASSPEFLGLADFEGWVVVVVVLLVVCADVGVDVDVEGADV